MTIAELDTLAQRHASSITPAPTPQPTRIQVTARDARHQILGGIKIIARICGVDMTQDIHPTEMLVQRIDSLEDLVKAQQAEIAEYRKALCAVGTVLEVHDDPFELRPSSKWSKAELGQWIISAGESIKWVMQRAENALDPAHAVPIAKDPD
jgi:hypothetical protein